MEISLLKMLLNQISLFSNLSSCDCINSECVLKYYQKAEDILKLLKPVLHALFGSEIASEEVFKNAFEELGHSIEELRELLKSWKPLPSKVYLVLQSDSLISKIRRSTLDIFQLLQCSHEYLSSEFSSTLEHCVQKIKHMGHEETPTIMKDALRNQLEGVEPCSDILVKIADSLGLRSNQEILIEAVSLEKLKENAEQVERNEEAEYIDQMVALVNCMHDHLIVAKQSQSHNQVPIPSDFCCPLSLELMTDPVIVASGQTYERSFIKRWIDLGLTICPKTRQTLSHTNLIPNYTVKGLIANWCELHKVMLPDPIKSVNLTLPSALLGSRQSDGNTKFPGKNLNSQCENHKPLLRRSQMEDSLPSSAGNSLGSDIARLSPRHSENTLPGQINLSPSRTNNGSEQPSNHSRTSSASSPVSTPPKVMSSDLSGDAESGSQREQDFPARLLDLRARNHTLRRRPSDRFRQRMVSSSTPAEMRPDLSELEAQVQKLIQDLNNPSPDTVKAATAELRLLAKHNMDNRIVIANCGAITILVNLLHSQDPKIQENAVTALLNLSINDNNKTAIAQADAIEPLIHVLETGTPEAKENSAATLFSLSVIEDNKVRIGRSGAIIPLVDLLGNGTPRGKKDAATALFNLSIFHENKARVVQAGAVRHLVELMDPAAGMVDKAVAVLSNLATILEGRNAIGQEGGIPVLVEVVELGSARGKENAAAALLHLCTNSSRFCNMVLQEGAVPPLVALSQSGTPRAKEKAQALLSYFRNHRHGNAGRG